MIDVKAIEKAAQEEVRREQEAAAKNKLTTKLKEIVKARAVVANLEHEYQVLLASIGGDA